MLKLKMKLWTLLITCLSLGCATVKLPKIEDQERCWSLIEHNVCACQMYRISPESVGPVTKAVEKPLMYCNKFGGFSPKDIAIKAVWHQEVFDTVNDANDNKFTSPLFEKKEDIEELVNEFN